MRLSEVKTVEDWFGWRDNIDKTVEKTNQKDIRELQWEYTDVLYSFLGVYTLGVWAFYQNDENYGFNKRGIEIKNKEGHNVYSSIFLSESFSKHSDLNNLKPLTDYIKHYSSIGNVCPTWPGGNEHRGKSKCYDIPDVYFKRHELWYKELANQNCNAFLTGVVNSKYALEIKDFLGLVDTPRKYIEFLNHVNNVIAEREKLISRFLGK